ncbi:septal ring lytic transglycosylase RlpA family protein [Rhodoligotrophos defluvii]|uniref:septal ring lytic transglycosylase RlpA family protein n=1 Tax=Rhodoligotrophos defluvii TaxID=2561934 RepID=UPI0010C96347|nr:septal ring lytic transglycosylase RlpA family protein [Rhodoligotrophos defluvii]
MIKIRIGRRGSVLKLTLRQVRFLAPLAALLVIGGAVALTGCSSSKVSQKRDPFAGKGSPIYPGNGPLPKGGGRYHVGKPYEIAGRTYVPRVDPGYDKIGTASWYGPQFHRRMTSNGEWFDMEYLSAAHPTLPLPSYAKVTNVATGRSLIVRVNDRGPFVGNRIIDLSKRSAELLEVKRKGTGTVRVQYIGPAPLNDQGRHLMAMNEELRRGTPMRYMIAAADSRVGAGRGGVPVMVAHATPAHPPQPQPQPTTPLAPSSTASTTTASLAAPATPAVPVSTGSPGGQGYYIQAAALSNPDNADRVRSQLASLGPVEVMPVEAGARTLFRVRVGPLTDPASADSTLRGVIAAGYADARIVPASY